MNILSDFFYCVPQVSEKDIEHAHQAGVRWVVCNRPDNEDIGQASAQTVQSWCEARGMGFTFLPMLNTQISDEQLDTLEKILQENKGHVLAYCRSGIRSSILWSANEVRHHRKTPEQIISLTCNHGLNISMIYPLLQQLASQSE